MCIISVKPIGAEMPDVGTLNRMWQANADGAGFAYWRAGMSDVVINKGFMKLKALKTALSAFSFGVDDIVILHFRWATHGMVDAGNCHPFPLSANMGHLRTVEGAFPCAIAHNGIFGNMACHTTLSDTQKFIAKVLCNDAVIENIENPAIMELIAGYCGSTSKLVILKPGRLLLIGDFVKDESTGLIYSNSGYRKPTYGAVGHTAKADRDFPDDVDYDYPANQNTLHKNDECEYCNESGKANWINEYQLFLCEKCLEYNLMLDYDDDGMPVEPEPEDAEVSEAEVVK